MFLQSQNIKITSRVAEIDERLAMEVLFKPSLDLTTTRERIAKEVPLAAVDLVKDIKDEQQKDIERTINSYAIALVFGEKQATVAEKDRTHKLDAQLDSYDKDVAKYDPDGENAGFSNRPLLAKLKELKGTDREKLKEKFKNANKDSAVMKLPEEQRNLIINAILDRAESMAKRINKTVPGKISDVIKTAAPVDLEGLGATANYSGVIETNTPIEQINTQLAQIEVGIRTHIVSDQVIATGVSIKDVLNVQIINNYSPVIESDPNVINGTLSGPQAAGRCVRHSDVSARAQQYIDERYKGKGFILTLDEMIDPKHSATKTKAVIEHREKQAKKEEKDFFINKAKGEFFAERLSERQLLVKDMSQLRKQLGLQKALLADQQKYLATSHAKLHHAQVALAFIPGNPKGGVTPRYKNDPQIVALWGSRKNLPKIIDHIKEKVQEMEKEVKLTEGNLLNKVKKPDKMDKKIAEKAEKAWEQSKRR